LKTLTKTEGPKATVTNIISVFLLLFGLFATYRNNRLYGRSSTN